MNSAGKTEFTKWVPKVAESPVFGFAFLKCFGSVGI